LLAALRALHRNLYTLSHTGGLRGGNRRQSLVLGLLAWLAALRLVSQSLILEKELFASCPDKILSAVNTPERAVFKLRFGMAPFAVRAARHLYLCHDETPPTDKRLWQRASEGGLMPLRLGASQLLIVRYCEGHLSECLVFKTV
jgi:hypothetical protein